MTLNGTNTLSGDVTLNAGALALGTAQAQGNFTNVLVNATANTSGFAGTRFAISSGMNFASNVFLSMLGTTASPDFRCAFAATSGTNIWNAPITVGGSGAAQLASEGIGTRLVINGNIIGDSLTGSLLLRGGGSGIVNGIVNVPNGSVNLTDNSTWTINSTGNAWTNTTVASGILRIGMNQALPTNLVLRMAQAGSTGILDLNGFNQQIVGLADNGGIEIIANGSTNSDSTLILNTASTWTFGGAIQNTTSNGTRTVAFTLDGGGILTLRSNNTYSGQTTINSGTLALSGVGAIPNTATFALASGSALDASARADATLTLGVNQKLKGNGAFNVNGSMTNNGTIELKLNKAGPTLSNDSIHGLNRIIYGGTLNRIISGDSLGISDSFKLFFATNYGGIFVNIVPSTPGPGLVWNGSTLATDGTLRISALTTPSFTSTSLSGTNLVMGGSGGPAGGSYFVLSSTNIATPLANWSVVKTSLFDASGNFSVTNPIVSGVPQSFFILRVP